MDGLRTRADNGAVVQGASCKTTTPKGPRSEFAKIKRGRGRALITVQTSFAVMARMSEQESLLVLSCLPQRLLKNFFAAVLCSDSPHERDMGALVTRVPT